MFLNLNLLWEYHIELIGMELHGIVFTFPTRICRGVSGFASGCTCGVWCHELIIYRLYVGLFFLLIYSK